MSHRLERWQPSPLTRSLAFHLRCPLVFSHLSDSGTASKKPKVSATPTGLREGWNTPNNWKGKSKSKPTGSVSTPTPRKPVTVPLPSARKASVSHGSSSKRYAAWCSRRWPTIDCLRCDSGSSSVPKSLDADVIEAADVAAAAGGGLNEYDGGLQDEDDSAEGAAMAHAPAALWQLPSESEDSDLDGFVSTFMFSFTLVANIHRISM